MDLLLCAVAQARSLAIFTTDRDFARYAGPAALTLFGAKVWGPD